MGKKKCTWEAVEFLPREKKHIRAFEKSAKGKKLLETQRRSASTSKEIESDTPSEAQKESKVNGTKPKLAKQMTIVSSDDDDNNNDN